MRASGTLSPMLLHETSKLSLQYFSNILKVSIWIHMASKFLRLIFFNQIFSQILIF